MQVSAEIEGSIADQMAVRAERLSDAVETTVSAGAAQLRDALHAQVIAAGLGSQLANSWQARVWPNHHIDAAATVSTGAPEIIGAFDQGASIVPAAGGLWLAIPVDQTGRRASPAKVERQAGQPLRFIQPPGSSTAVLVLEPPVSAGRRAKPKVMFVLVRQVTLAKRLNIATAIADVHRWLPALLLQQQD